MSMMSPQYAPDIFTIYNLQMSKSLPQLLPPNSEGETVSHIQPYSYPNPDSCMRVQVLHIHRR